MKKRNWFLSIVTLFAVFTFAGQVQAQKLYKSTTGDASFFSEAPLENIEAKSTNLVSIINPENNQIAFTVFIKSFEFEKSLMQEHFNENYMESDKFPKATFSGKINEKVDLTKDGTYEVTVTGKLNIHGVEKERTIPGTITVKDKKLVAKSNFQVKVAEHDIEIPSMVVKNIAETVDVKVKAEYELK